MGKMRGVEAAGRAVRTGGGGGGSRAEEAGEQAELTATTTRVPLPAATSSALLTRMTDGVIGPSLCHHQRPQLVASLPYPW